MHRLSVCLSFRVCSSGHLCEFLFHRRAGKARLDSPERIDIRACLRSWHGCAGWTRGRRQLLWSEARGRGTVFTRGHGGRCASGAAGLVCWCFGCWFHLVFLLCSFLGLQGYRECHPVKTNQRLSAAARRSHPAQGLIPIALVARLITSPRPTSFSVTKPGRRIRRGRRSRVFLVVCFVFISLIMSNEIPA